MAALSADRRTPRRTHPEGIVAGYKMKASTTIHAGSLVMLDDKGLAVPATKAASHVPVGRAEHPAKSGAAGDTFVECRQGIFRWDNLAADAVAAAEVGDKVFVEDDQTIRKAANAAGVAVGKLVEIDDAGAWVATGFLYT
ncbi:MAG: hypothetical protein OXC10_12235 [Rhodospirillaceae bacterium]|nr:hypothetical protein [Rhodospirillaceae bacterium]